MTAHVCHDSDARDLAERAWNGAAEAVKGTAVVQGQFRTIIGLLCGISAALLGVFGWLVTEVRTVADVAATRAAIVAESTVLKSDRRIEDKLSTVAQDAARMALRERDQQIDRLAAVAPQRSSDGSK